MINFDLPKGYIEHDGKCCPFDNVEAARTNVSIYCADAASPEDSIDHMKASYWEGGLDDWWCWSKTDTPDDRIVAYKVIPEQDLI